MPNAILNWVPGKLTRPRTHARRRQLRTSALSQLWPSRSRSSSMWRCWLSLPRASTAKASKTLGWKMLPTTWAMRLGPMWYVLHALLLDFFAYLCPVCLDNPKAICAHFILFAFSSTATASLPWGHTEQLPSWAVMSPSTRYGVHACRLRHLKICRSHSFGQ